MAELEADAPAMNGQPGRGPGPGDQAGGGSQRAALPLREAELKSPARPSKRQKQVRFKEDSSQPDDGHHWHKYGQKAIVGSNFTRAYFRCAQRQAGCPAKRLIDREHAQPGTLRVTYEGDHNHEPPAQPVRRVVLYSTAVAPSNPPLTPASSSSQSAVEPEGVEARSHGDANLGGVVKARLGHAAAPGFGGMGLPAGAGPGGGLDLGLCLAYSPTDPQYDVYRHMMVAAAGAPMYSWQGHPTAQMGAAALRPAMMPQGDPGMAQRPVGGQGQGQVAGVGGLPGEAQVQAWAVGAVQGWGQGWNHDLGNMAMQMSSPQVQGQVQAVRSMQGGGQAGSGFALSGQPLPYGWNGQRLGAGTGPVGVFHGGAGPWQGSVQPIGGVAGGHMGFGMGGSQKDPEQRVAGKGSLKAEGRKHGAAGRRRTKVANAVAMRSPELHAQEGQDTHEPENMGG